MNLSNIPKLKGKSNKKTKIGRGYGSGHGGHTSTRGQKGQKSRTGSRIPWFFEGGQLPLVKRLPHLSGFKNVNRVENVVVKTSLLNTLSIKGKITPSVLVKLGVIKKSNNNSYKVLFDKKIDSDLVLSGFKYSKKALDSLIKSGGQAK